MDGAFESIVQSITKQTDLAAELDKKIADLGTRSDQAINHQRDLLLELARETIRVSVDEDAVKAALAALE
jgi:hypothetical protein